MAVRINGPRAARAGRLLLRWEFSEPDETWPLLLSNRALTPLRGDAGVLRDAQHAPVGQADVHLLRGLGSRCQLEDATDAVDGERLAGSGDVDGGRDQSDRAEGGGLAEAPADPARGSLGQDGTVHVAGAAGHRGARHDVLVGRVCEEAGGGDHGDASDGDVGLVHHATHASDPARRAARGCRARGRAAGRGQRWPRTDGSARHARRCATRWSRSSWNAGSRR
ncbi:hypothetical protein [Streptomyces sp. NPDC003247]|uniref:hypothetical protein n=1 Tax=Streptomyces sp. NPDC003247 TaxID=3364677 RepID=UPI0036BA8A39